VVPFFGAAILKPDRDYRVADTVIGLLLGAFVGGSIGIALWYVNRTAPTMAPLFLISACVVAGGVISGALAFLLGKRYTDSVESFISAVREFLRQQP
jgi:hypothetical protein